MSGDLRRQNEYRILIVQEHQSDRESMRGVLEPDYQVDTAGDGLEGLSRVLECKPDLVVLDLVLPGLPGLEVIHALQSTGQDIAIIATVGADRRAEDWLRASIMGAQKLLRKPISAEELRGSVGAVISGEHPSKRGPEADDAASLLLESGPTRVVEEDEFERLVARAVRMDRAFGQRSSVALLQARSAGLRDRALGVAADVLRSGDFLTSAGGDKLLMLVPLTHPERIPAIFDRLAKPFEESGVALRQLRCGAATVERVHASSSLAFLFDRLVPWGQSYELLE